VAYRTRQSTFWNHTPWLFLVIKKNYPWVGVQLLKRCSYFSGADVNKVRRVWHDVACRCGVKKLPRENARARCVNGGGDIKDWPLSHVAVGPISVWERFPRCVASSFLKLLCLRTDQLSGWLIRCGAGPRYLEGGHIRQRSSVSYLLTSSNGQKQNQLISFQKTENWRHFTEIS